MTAEKKRVLVTGGARGMGEAIVRRLATSGYNVHFTYARSAERAQEIVRELNVTASLCDLSRRDEVESFAVALENSGPYYAFIHNAGMTYDSLAAMVEQVEAERLMQVNFWSFVRIAKALVRPMTHARSGRIIAIGSVTAERGSQGNAVYAASKSALKGFVTTLAIEPARMTPSQAVNWLAADKARLTKLIRDFGIRP